MVRLRSPAGGRVRFPILFQPPAEWVAAPGAPWRREALSASLPPSGPPRHVTPMRRQRRVQFSFEATVLHWRGPSPYFFAPIPRDQADEIRRLAKLVSYGWGVIPVEATVAGVVFTTSLFPKDETYLLPLKDAVRRKAAVTAGDRISVEMDLRPARSAP